MAQTIGEEDVWLRIVPGTRIR